MIAMTVIKFTMMMMMMIVIRKTFTYVHDTSAGASLQNNGCRLFPIAAVSFRHFAGFVLLSSYILTNDRKIGPHLVRTLLLYDEILDL